MSNRERELEELNGHQPLPQEVLRSDRTLWIVDPNGDHFFWWRDGEAHWPTNSSMIGMYMDHGEALLDGNVLVRCRQGVLP